MLMRWINACWVAASMAACLAPSAPSFEPGFKLVPGTSAPGRQPDGNSVILDAPEGLIVVDTGRHAPMQEAILGYASERGRPIAAIFNTHWHLDHTGGNAEIRSVFPRLRIHSSRAIEGALAGFLARSKQAALDYIAAGKADAETIEEIHGDIAAFDERVSLIPTDPITESGEVEIAGRRLQVRLAPHAVTEADVWIYEPDEKLAIVGDLVVAHVPYFDTACPDGWSAALAEVAAVPFELLIPGHGEPMTRQQFDLWRAAFDELLACAATERPAGECAAGWRRNAAPFVGGRDPKAIDGAINYYFATRLRSPTGRTEYCGQP